jgi:RND family efflux transporter MFP subunit
MRVGTCAFRVCRRGPTAVVIVSLLTTGAHGADLPFATATVTSRDIVRERVLEGTVEAVNQSTVSAQISGRIAAIYYDVDDYVPKGAVILRFRDTEQRAQVAKAEADVREARARLSEAEKTLERVEKLHVTKLISKADLDRAKANRDASQSRLEAAEAVLAQAREQLAYTVVRAPYAGIVTARHVEIGESATPGKSLMTGFSLEQLRVRVDVPQQMVEKIRDIGKARVILPSGGAESVPTQGITVFPYANKESNTFAVRVRLPDNIEHLFPGMLVKVAFEVGRRTSLAVPAKALVYRSEVTGVYVVKADGTVVLRQVRPGREADDGMIEILGGLNEGERIALDPLRAGVYLKEAVSGAKQ